MNDNNKYSRDPIVNKICEGFEEVADGFQKLYERIQEMDMHALVKSDTDGLVQNLPLYMEEIIAPKYTNKAMQKYIQERLYIWSMSFLAQEEALEEKKDIIKQDRATAEKELDAIQEKMVYEFDKFAAEKQLENIRRTKAMTKSNVVNILEYKDEKESNEALKYILEEYHKSLK